MSILGTQSVITINVTAPAVVRRLSDITLHCDYHLNGGSNQPYALSWFHNSVLVMSYKPLSRPQIHGEPVSRTLRVNLALSSRNQLHLHNVDWNVTGNWTCQVMTEGPSFEMIEASTYLKVVGKQHFLT